MWYEVFLDILIVVVMLAVLVALHEAGHLGMAKLFKVYCFEYSVGFGPKLLKVKRKNGETYFSLRAIPFGGYVSMYGEAGAVPEGFEEPPVERSLESIAKWKKCLILVAGVTVNFIVGMVLIYIGDAAFPMYYYAHAAIADNSSTTSNVISVTTDPVFGSAALSYFEANKGVGYEAKDYFLHLPVATIDGNTFPILDSNVHFMIKDGDIYKPGEGHYVAVYSPSSLVNEHTLASSIALYPVSEDPVPQNLKELGVNYLPKYIDADKKSTKVNTSLYADGDYIDLNLTFIPLQKGHSEDKNYAKTQYEGHRLEVNNTPIARFTIGNKAFQNNEIKLGVISHHYTFVESWGAWANDFKTACGAIGQGLVSLFQPGGFQNLSGIVGITAAMPQIRASGGARMVFFFSGLISINLAFFNLLPFPGLDGWQLVVTIIEGVSKKKVPEKAKSIMSIIGLVLLMGLAGAILIKDVVALFIR